MTKFILHGGYERRDNDLNKSFYKEMVQDVPSGGKVLFVYFANESNSHEKDLNEQIKMIEPHSLGKSVTYTLATEENFMEQVTRSDVIHLRGGNTRKLIATLKKYPNLKPFIEGKTVSGSSAGAYALAKYGAAHSEKVVREGLGLVPIRVVCHSESTELAPSSESVIALENIAPNLELIYLKDYEWKTFVVEW